MSISGVFLMIAQTTAFLDLAIGHKLDWISGMNLIFIWLSTLLNLLDR